MYFFWNFNPKSPAGEFQLQLLVSLHTKLAHLHFVFDFLLQSSDRRTSWASRHDETPTFAEPDRPMENSWDGETESTTWRREFEDRQHTINTLRRERHAERESRNRAYLDLERRLSENDRKNMGTLSATLQAERNSHQQEMNVLQRKHQDLLDEFSRVQQALDESRQRLADVERTNRTRRTPTYDFRAERQAQQREIDDLRREKQVMLDEHERHFQALEEVQRRQRMEVEERHREELKTVREVLRAENLVLQTDIENRQEEIVELRRRRNAEREEHDRSLQALRDAQSRRTSQIEQQHEEEIASLRTTLQRDRARLQELERLRNQPVSQVSRDVHRAASWEIDQQDLELSGTILGVGAWGSVIRGTYRGCQVAVKQLHTAILSENNLSLFRREMEIAARLRHPCLVQFIGGKADTKLEQGCPINTPMIVSELMDTDLRRILPTSPCADDRKRISTDIALALNFLHLTKPNPVLHRDISSANVLLCGSPGKWRGKLADLGSANIAHNCTTKFPGAPPYSAPEAPNPEEHSPKMDVFSFGILLVETYVQPWEMPTPGRRRQRAVCLQSPPLRDIVCRCLQDSPRDRPGVMDIVAVLQKM